MNRDGLCDTCRHKFVITSDRGSVFLRCELSKTDGRFEKYPSIPLWYCAGYVQAEDPSKPVRSRTV